MSHPNVVLHQHIVDAYNERDIETIIRFADPEVEFDSVFASAVGDGLYHGHEGLRRWHRDLGDAWGERIRISPERYFARGDDTLLLFVMNARGQQSGAEIGTGMAMIVRWRGGKFVYSKTYARREDALRDFGVPEAELEPIDF